jgi:hypothetical protein
MRILLVSVLAAALLAMVGCATPPLAVTPVGLLSHAATLEYAYGDAPSFHLTSGVATVVLVVPRAAEELETAQSDQAQLNRPSRVQQKTTGESTGSTTAGSTQEERTATATTHSVEVAGHTTTDAFAATGDGTVSFSTNTVELETEQVVVDEAGEKHVWTTRMPVLKTWPVRPQAVVGTEFAFVIEVKNETPMDLTRAEIRDRLDARLVPLTAKVSASPRTRLDARLEDQDMVIRLPNGLARGRTVQITIPVLVSGL